MHTLEKYDKTCKNLEGTKGQKKRRKKAFVQFIVLKRII